eukprot:gene40903-50331_t
MRFDVVTLFPEMFSALTQWGITGRAYDRAYGGGPGMVMMAKPLEDTVAGITAAHQA